MRAVLDRVAVLHHDDAVGEAQRRPPVRDEDRRAVLHHLAQRRVDLLLDARVDRRCRVVEHQDPRVGEDRPRDRDALPLPARQREAALADHGVEPVGERLDELRGSGDLGRPTDLLVGRVGAAVGDVVADGVGEEERVLEHDADLASQRVERDVAHVDAVDA